MSELPLAHRYAGGEDMGQRVRTIEQRLQRAQYPANSWIAQRVDALWPVVFPAPSASVIGGSLVPVTNLVEGTWYLARAGFVVPVPGGKITVAGSLACQSKMWNTFLEADAWLEIAGIAASARTTIDGPPYNTLRTASPTSIVLNPLAAGQYEARWVVKLLSGNRVQAVGGGVTVTYG